MQFATSDVLDGVGLEAVEQLKLVKRHKRLYITSTKAGTSSPDGNSIRCSVLREELHFIAVHAKVILRTPMRTRSNSFSDALFWTHFLMRGPWRHLLVYLVS
jgi:hypothetical protein